MGLDPAQPITCRGRLCHYPLPLGLDLSHFHPAHTLHCFLLILASFLAHWWMAYTCLHPERRLLRRCLWAGEATGHVL